MEGKGIKEHRQRGGFLRTAVAFTLGATIGSVIALLYAPASGKVTRRRLMLKARNLQRVAARRLGQTTRVLATQAGHVREAATQWIAGHLPGRNGSHPIRRRVVHHAASH